MISRPKEAVQTADLYLWLGDGGARDYSAFEGARVWLLNVRTGQSRRVGKVQPWKDASWSAREAGGKDLTMADEALYAVKGIVEAALA